MLQEWHSPPEQRWQPLQSELVVQRGLGLGGGLLPPGPDDIPLSDG